MQEDATSCGMVTVNIMAHAMFGDTLWAVEERQKDGANWVLRLCDSYESRPRFYKYSRHWMLSIISGRDETSTTCTAATDDAVSHYELQVRRLYIHRRKSHLSPQISLASRSPASDNLQLMVVDSAAGIFAMTPKLSNGQEVVDIPVAEK